MLLDILKSITFQKASSFLIGKNDVDMLTELLTIIFDPE